MENHFQILIDKNRLSAMLQPLDNSELNKQVSLESIKKLLSAEKVTFGISEGAIKKICENPLSVQYPFPIAEGIPAADGCDAYLLNEVWFEEKVLKEKFNFRDVLHIPSVGRGQVLASITPQHPEHMERMCSAVSFLQRTAKC